MRRVFRYTGYPLIMAILLVAVGCVPEPLSGDLPVANNDNNTQMNNPPNNNPPNNPPNNNNGGDFSAEFIQIANIVRMNCALAPCHGQASANELVIPANQFASDQEVADALADQTPLATGLILVVPGEPDQSDFYARLVTDDASLLMPQGNPLPDAQIDLIRDWILAGANVR